jgi:hypothetical protein
MKSKSSTLLALGAALSLFVCTQAFARSDASFMKQAAENGNAEVEASKLAQTKAKRPEVKAFADQMVTDHTKVGDELKQLAASKKVDLPTEPSVMISPRLSSVMPNLNTSVLGVATPALWKSLYWSVLRRGKLRSTVPRVRIDQLMMLNWKWLVPISVANVIVTAFLLQVIKALGLVPQSGDFIAALPQTIILLAGNLVLGIVVFGYIGRAGRAQRAADQAVQIHVDHDDHAPITAVGD